MLSYFVTLQHATQNCGYLFVDMQIFSINFHVMLTPVITMFAIIVAIAYLNKMRSETYNVDMCLISYNLHFLQFICYNSSCCNYIVSTESEFVYIFLQNLSKTQFYPDEAITFIVFTYGKITLCHTAYATGRAMECQEFRH